MNREMKAVIFDLDGVLCFTDKYHYQAWKAIADRLGIYFDEKINDRLRGISRMASLEIILEKSDRQYTLEEKEVFAEEKNAQYQKLLQQMSEKDMSDEVRQTLAELRHRGYRLAVGSSMLNLFSGRLALFLILTRLQTEMISQSQSLIRRYF